MCGSGPTGPNVQPIKVQKPNPEPFSRMTLHQQNAFHRDHHSYGSPGFEKPYDANTPGYVATSYDDETPMDKSILATPRGRL